MPNILDQIIAHKHREVAEAQAAQPLEELHRRAADAPPPRDFFAAVTTPSDTVRVIAEVKQASPSAGLIREDFDPVAIARAYADAGAAAISCLTDEKFFRGSLTDLSAIRQAVPVPVLRKEFIIDPYQVVEARAAGADAVLLIAECLNHDELATLVEAARRQRMAVLLEIHEAANLDRAAAHVGRERRVLLGVNNRDLRAMATDLDHTLKLVRRVNDPSLLVSESGIRTHEDIHRLQAAGVNAVLVGEHLMRQPNVGNALRSLIHG